MVFYYHLSYMYHKKTPLNLASNKNFFRQRKLVTIIFSFIPIFTWNLCANFYFNKTANPILNSMVFTLATILIFTIINVFIIGIISPNKVKYYKEYFQYIMHNAVAFPILGIFATLTFNGFKKIVSGQIYNYLFLLFSTYFIYLIVNEIMYKYHKKYRSKNIKYKPIADLDFEGDWVLKTLKNHVNMSINKKNGDLYVLIKDDEVKIKGYERSGMLYADLSGELPRLELYHTENNGFSGLYTVKDEDKVKIIPVQAMKKQLN